jgi:topoisomerase IA-like protein
MTEQIGEFENKPVKIGFGTHGNYIVHDGVFFDVESKDEMENITIHHAINLIQSRREVVVLYTIGEYTIFKSSTGYFVTDRKWTAPISPIDQFKMDYMEEKDLKKIIHDHKMWKKYKA